MMRMFHSQTHARNGSLSERRPHPNTEPTLLLVSSYVCKESTHTMMNRTKVIAFTIACSTAATLAFAAGAPAAPEKTYVGCLAKSDNGAYKLTNILGAAAAGAPTEIRVESASAGRVDLAKHVGEKVSVRGTEAANGGQTTLSVAFVAKLAKACS